MYIHGAMLQYFMRMRLNATQLASVLTSPGNDRQYLLSVKSTAVVNCRLWLFYGITKPKGQFGEVRLQAWLHTFYLAPLSGCSDPR